MSVRYATGDLFTSGLPVIAHGCNAQGAMGAGLAKTVRTFYPAMYDTYRALCLSGTLKLGSVLYWQSGPDLPSVFNLITQERWGVGVQASTTAIQKALTLMVAQADDLGITQIGLPWIGCGLGGLKKIRVKPLFELVLGQWSGQAVVFSYDDTDRRS